MCGGTIEPPSCLSPSAGLSPRVRGNHSWRNRRIATTMSIPACAGEPPIQRRQSRQCGVYPRVCGGTREVLTAANLNNGLSPRVRGNRHARQCDGEPVRSIPACAGEPSVFVWWLSVCRVYPRVRGTPYPVPPTATAVGSIPACAGEPAGGAGSGGEQGVYPRVCGGTNEAWLDGRLRGGLSPRVRGNPIMIITAVAFIGSIPACAGEPLCALTLLDSLEVYPRVCGGTSLSW